MKKLAVVLYSIGSLITALLCFAYFTANAHLEPSVGVNQIAWSAVPIFVLMAMVTYVQSQSEQVLWMLPAIVLAAAFTLFMAMVNHAFPDKAAVWSIVHLVIVAAGGIFLAWFKGHPRVSTL